MCRLITFNTFFRTILFSMWTDAHILRHCSRSLSQPCSSRTGEPLSLGAQSLTAAKSCCPISVRLQPGKLAHAARPFTHTSFSSSARTLFPVARRLWPSCHFDLWGLETWLGVLKSNTTSSLTEALLLSKYGNR